MRPLFFEEPHNAALYNTSDTYLWGDAFLVHPITKPGVTIASVYFPKKNDWFDFYTGKKYTGGMTENVAVTEDHIPVFVRANSFVPMIKTIPNTALYSIDNFDLHFYFDPSKSIGHGQLYNDDGKTPNTIADKQYEILDFWAKTNNNELVISIGNYLAKNFNATDKNIKLYVHNLANAKKVTVNGKNSTFKVANNALEIPVTLEKGTTKDIKIEF